MFNRVKSVFAVDSEIMKRIKDRHYAFWKDPQREIINQNLLIDSFPPEVWKAGENWQRRLSNKCNSREFAKRHGCKVAELYWRGRNVREIDFEGFPDHFVLKPTIGHGGKGIWLMSEGRNLFDNRLWSDQKLREAMDQLLRREEKAEFEVLEFVRTEREKYEIPVDYKIFTFDGAIACIEVINRAGPNKGTQSFYDENWNELKAINRSYPSTNYQEPPECLEEMLQQARILSKAYEIFVRIDFYASDKGPIFGEFAPTPSMGGRYTSYGSNLLVSYWDKYCKGLI